MDRTTPIVKSEGITASEKLLAKLGEHTFLSLWSYPGIYRDQGISENGEGKEVCDLLVVFGEDILAFSDKTCAFPSTGDAGVDWGRWFRHAIEGGAKQLWGAERWIRDHPDRLFLDRACTQRFPVPVPSLDSARYHLVAIANGSAERTRKEFGGRGGLFLELSLKGIAQHRKLLTVGDLDPNRTFVHVFDDVARPHILSTLDTIADFVRYLRRRSAFCRSQVELLARCELDLLALYLRNESDPGQHEFVPTEGAEFVVVDAGFWDDFEQSPEWQARLKWAQVSYLWDSLIEGFAHHTLAELTNSQFRRSPSRIRFSDFSHVNRVRAAACLARRSAMPCIGRNPTNGESVTSSRSNRGSHTTSFCFFRRRSVQRETSTARGVSKFSPRAVGSSSSNTPTPWTSSDWRWNPALNPASDRSTRHI